MYKNIDKNLIPTELSNIVLSMANNTESDNDYTEVSSLINTTVQNFTDYNNEEISLLFFDFILSSFYSKKDENENLLIKIKRLIDDGIFSSSLFEYSFIEAVFNKTFILEEDKIEELKNKINSLSNYDCVRYLYLDKLLKLLIYSGNFIDKNKDLYVSMIDLKSNFSEDVINLTKDFTQGFFYLI